MQLPASHDPEAFATGVDDASKAGDLLAHLFAVRTKGLFGDLESSALPAYLSGLLIGHELNDLPDRVESLHLIAGEHLLNLYDEALCRRGFHPHSHPDVLAARGLYALAQRRNLR
jgi:2-dehydro-3-deoxygalactonokinase